MIALMSIIHSPMVMADNVFNPICEDGSLTENQKIEAGCDTKSQEGMGRIMNIINVAIGLAGLVAVVVVVFGGQRYLTSAGEPGRVKQAKDMVMYGLIGLVVAMLAWAITNFILMSVSNIGADSGGTNNSQTNSQEKKS